jgi:hypothetical protein
VEVVDKYHEVILMKERVILLKPNMKTVRGCKHVLSLSSLIYTENFVLTVHILSGDLTLHKRTLGPLSQLVYGLRRYDVDRCKASTYFCVILSLVNAKRPITNRHSQVPLDVKVNNQPDVGFAEL